MNSDGNVICGSHLGTLAFKEAFQKSWVFREHEAHNRTRH